MELGNLGTIVVVIVFIGIVFWVFSKKRKARWDEDAKIPFEDDPKSQVKSDDQEPPRGNNQ